MKQKIVLFILCFITFCANVIAQEAGISKYGTHSTCNSLFIDQYGIDKAYPRLNKYGQILYYSPLVTTDSIVIDNGVTLFANIEFEGWSSILSRGFEYSIYADYIPKTQISCGRGSGIYSHILNNLAQNTHYYVRAYAQNSSGYGYGNTLTFSTPMGEVVAGNMTITSIQPNSLSVRIPINESGGSALTTSVCAFPNERYQSDEAICINIPPTSTFPINATIVNLTGNTTYYLRAIVSNSDYSDTTYAQAHTPSDLALNLISNKGNSITLCSDTTIAQYTANLTGTDPNRSNYQYSWSSTRDSGITEDSIFNLLHTQAGTCTIAVKAFYLGDTLRKQISVTVVNKTIPNPTFCEDEFLAEINITNNMNNSFSSIFWINQQGDTIARGNTLSRFPRGAYKAIAITSQGCIIENDVWLGKRVTTCPLATAPTLPTERAHFENGVWLLDSVADHEDNWYAITSIGEQCWLRQNMRATTSPKTGQNLYFDIINSGRNIEFYPYAEYYSYDLSVLPKYGMYYNFPATIDTILTNYIYSVPANHRGICPEGWHLPSNAEMTTMLYSVARSVDSVTTILPPFDFESGCLGTTVQTSHMLLYECNPIRRANNNNDLANFSAFAIDNLNNGTAVFRLSTIQRAGYCKTLNITGSCVSRGVGAYNRLITVRCLRN